MSGTREGGCLCGAVRYEVSWPPQSLVVCHCTDCQKQAGTAFSVVGVTARGDIAVTGALKVYHHHGSSGQSVFRQFCAECGSPVLTDTDTARADGIIFFKAGTLDESADLTPQAHLWTRSAQSWFDLPDDVTCLEKQ